MEDESLTEKGHIFHFPSLSEKGATPLQNWQKNRIWDDDSMFDLSRAARFFTSTLSPNTGY